ncbi:hypothetical protein ED28_10755 [[Pantoea] beijingensis]|uniref:Zinc finger DksA/TraR C4-type domain-containing protein n=1 Tax=[Pantoea] beijingensis TaxID=1324864 RepID=A0A443ICU3_9GAMM|nr:MULTISPECIES: DksA/TraR family C4-type zinc finger protein [Erwiniaceae]RWR02101.1 hypothetical protein ED28_10755 [[Pantoea] beijingensis]
MANGWAHDGAVQQQIDSTVDDAVQRARQNLHHGVSAEYCKACGEAIPEARRLALTGVQFCVQCQQAHDKKSSTMLYNRRGSKDSQLR